MTDAPTTNRTHRSASSSGAPNEAVPAETLGVLSLSTASDNQPAFDPAAALIAAATADDSSVEEVVLLRLLVLRRLHPDAIVRTHLERVEDGQVVVRADVALSTGAAASAYATAGGGVASIERTEYRALGRALDALGEAVLVDITRQGDEALATRAGDLDVHADREDGVLPDLPEADQLGTHDDDAWADEDPYPASQAAPDGDDVDQDALMPDVPSPAREIPPSRFSPTPPRGRANARPEPEPARQEAERAATPPPAVVDAVRRANLRRHAVGQPERGAAELPHDQREEMDASGSPHEPDDFDLPADSAPAGHRLGSVVPDGASDAGSDEPPLENYSWTAFWRVARPLGLDKMKVEELIGGSITPLTPLQVREKLKDAGVDI